MPADRSSHDWGFFARNRMRLTYATLLFGALISWFFGVRPVSLLADSAQGIAALVMLTMGLALRSWCAGILFKDQRVATAGPYALCRHPLYMANTLLLCGWAMQFGGLILALPMVLISALLYSLTLADEEQAVSAKFPQQWQQYCAQTGRFAPKTWPLPLQADWTAAQWRANHEYELLVAAALIAIILEGLVAASTHL